MFPFAEYLTLTFHKSGGLEEVVDTALDGVVAVENQGWGTGWADEAGGFSDKRVPQGLDFFEHPQSRARGLGVAEFVPGSHLEFAAEVVGEDGA